MAYTWRDNIISKLTTEWKDVESAEKIVWSIWQKKYWKQGMENKPKRGRILGRLSKKQ